VIAVLEPGTDRQMKVHLRRCDDANPTRHEDPLNATSAAPMEGSALDDERSGFADQLNQGNTLSPLSGLVSSTVPVSTSTY
jgi:hypothetical protein